MSCAIAHLNPPCRHDVLLANEHTDTYLLFHRAAVSIFSFMSLSRFTGSSCALQSTTADAYPRIPAGLSYFVIWSVATRLNPRWYFLKCCSYSPCAPVILPQSALMVKQLKEWEGQGESRSSGVQWWYLHTNMEMYKKKKYLWAAFWLKSFLKLKAADCHLQQLV